MAAIPVFLNGESSGGGGGGGRGERIDEVSSSAILPMMDMFEDEDPEEDDMLVDNSSLQMTKPTKNLFSLIEKIDAEQQTDDDGGGVDGEATVTIQECPKCQTLEQDNQKAVTQITSKYETEIARVR